MKMKRRGGNYNNGAVTACGLLPSAVLVHAPSSSSGVPNIVACIFAGLRRVALALRSVGDRRAFIAARYLAN